jgi:hypothetical protein
MEPDGGGGVCAVLATRDDRCAHSEAPKVNLTGVLQVEPRIICIYLFFYLYIYIFIIYIYISTQD